jgi:putative membrane protein
MKNKNFYLLVTLKGLCMGAADVIPGVSGGTIAFLTGIYEELVNSIKSIDFTAVKMIFKGEFRDFWKKINGNFLFSVAIGILISIFSLAKLMQYLLLKTPVPIWSFFFGLILTSAIIIIKGIKDKKWINILPFVSGIAVGIIICLISPSESPNNLWFIFLCGVIAICAMILPGISGSFILLLLGKYSYIMQAVSEFNLIILIVFAIGAVIGIISFSNLLSWLMKKYYKATLFLMSGLMIGSLLKVWPWKRVLESGVDRPILPFDVTGNPHIIQAIVFFIIGIALVIGIELIAKKLKK